jgi:hypothetical protein
MGQHLGQGHELDRRGRLPDDCGHLLCARWSQGAAVPGQQDARWTGCCADDHIREEGWSGNIMTRWMTTLSIGDPCDRTKLLCTAQRALRRTIQHSAYLELMSDEVLTFMSYQSTARRSGGYLLYEDCLNMGVLGQASRRSKCHIVSSSVCLTTKIRCDRSHSTAWGLLRNCTSGEHGHHRIHMAAYDDVPEAHLADMVSFWGSTSTESR